MHATKLGKTKICKALVEFCGADVNSKSPQDFSTATHFAIKGGNPVLTEYFISKNADLNSQDKSGRSCKYLLDAYHDEPHPKWDTDQVKGINDLYNKYCNPFELHKTLANIGITGAFKAALTMLDDAFYVKYINKLIDGNPKLTALHCLILYGSVLLPPDDFKTMIHKMLEKGANINITTFAREKNMDSYGITSTLLSDLLIKQSKNEQFPIQQLQNLAWLLSEVIAYNSKSFELHNYLINIGKDGEFETAMKMLDNPLYVNGMNNLTTININNIPLQLSALHCIMQAGSEFLSEDQFAQIIKKMLKKGADPSISTIINGKSLNAQDMTNNMLQALSNLKIQKGGFLLSNQVQQIKNLGWLKKELEINKEKAVMEKSNLKDDLNKLEPIKLKPKPPQPPQ